MTRVLTALGISALIATALPTQSSAQTARRQTSSPQTMSKKASGKTIKIVNKRSLPTVSMDVRGVSLKQALAKLFYASKVDFVFEGDIPTGLVTAKIKNQPFETALRLVLDSASAPLTYQRSGNVYLIHGAKYRPVNRNVNVAANNNTTAAPPSDVPADTNNGGAFENNTTVATGYNFTPAPTGGYQASPDANTLILNPSGNNTGRNFGPLFGQPFGYPPVIYANPGGFGYPYNNTGFYGWTTGPVNTFGGTGFYYVNP